MSSALKFSIYRQSCWGYVMVYISRIQHPRNVCMISSLIIFRSITVTSWWVRWRLKSPASRLLTQPFIQAKIKENIKALRHGLFEGNSPVTVEFRTQRVSNAENVSIWWRHHEVLKSNLGGWSKVSSMNVLKQLHINSLRPPVMTCHHYQPKRRLMVSTPWESLNIKTSKIDRLDGGMKDRAFAYRDMISKSLL